MRFSKLGFGAAVVMAGVCLAGSAFAQEAEAGGEVGMTLPGAAPAGQARATEGDSDHDQMIGRFAVGYMGAYQVPLADVGDQTAPAIGLRYWLDQMMGLDVGIGFYNAGGSTTDDPGSTVDDAAIVAVLIHGGVPLHLGGGKHFSFQLVPEVNVGFATQNQKDPAPSNGEDARSGVLIQLGARAGGELQFGFIGVPELSLQAGVGLYYTSRTTKSEYTNGNVKTVHEESKFNLGTTLTGTPWDIFTSNIAALYYF